MDGPMIGVVLHDYSLSFSFLVNPERLPCLLLTMETTRWNALYERKRSPTS